MHCTILGNPCVIQTPHGNAIEFDGIDDAIFIDTRPLAGVRINRADYFDGATFLSRMTPNALNPSDKMGGLMKKLILTVITAGALLAAVNPPAEKEVLAALDTWRNAVMKRDRAAYDKILHPDLTYAHSNGLVETKEQQFKHMMESSVTYEAVPISDTKVHVHGANIALTPTKMEFHQRSKDGKLTIVQMQVLMVWMKTPQGWQLIGRQSTRPNAK
jgi:ketosteroid isomerase-like protein